MVSQAETLGHPRNLEKLELECFSDCYTQLADAWKTEEPKETLHKRKTH